MGALQFDSREGQRLAEEGKKLSARNREFLLSAARSNAEYISRYIVKGPITCDDVRRYMDETGYPDALGNAWGSLFLRSEWEWTGEYRRSKLTSNHGNLQKVWRLR